MSFFFFLEEAAAKSGAPRHKSEQLSSKKSRNLFLERSSVVDSQYSAVTRGGHIFWRMSCLKKSSSILTLEVLNRHCQRQPKKSVSSEKGQAQRGQESVIPPLRNSTAGQEGASVSISQDVCGYRDRLLRQEEPQPCGEPGEWQPIGRRASVLTKKSGQKRMKQAVQEYLRSK